MARTALAMPVRGSRVAKLDTRTKGGNTAGESGSHVQCHRAMWDQEWSSRVKVNDKTMTRARG